MRVAYFSNQFADRSGHGLARFARELYGALTRRPEGLEIVPIAAWSSLPREDLARLQRATGLALLPTRRRLTPILWTYLKAPKLEGLLGKTVDVVHAVSLGYPIATRRPLIVTVHDLGPLTHPEFFTNTRPWIMKRSLDQAVQQAEAIVCVSQSTAAEVIGYVGGHIEDRIEVIPEGVSSFFFDHADASCLDGLEGLPAAGTPFVLTAGKISPRKNIQGVLKAMADIAGEVPHHLVLVGGRGWETDMVLQGLGDRELSSRTHLLGYVTDEQLRALYARASVYVHPSLYEGFGLTVLEAMAAGCPVITSNVYSLPEVAGDAAVLVDPRDTSALADAIREVVLDEKRQSELTGKGKQRAEAFRWEDCAAQMVKLYRMTAHGDEFHD